MEEGAAWRVWGAGMLDEWVWKAGGVPLSEELKEVGRLAQGHVGEDTWAPRERLRRQECACLYEGSHEARLAGMKGLGLRES